MSIRAALISAGVLAFAPAALGASMGMHGGLRIFTDDIGGSADTALQAALASGDLSGSLQTGMSDSYFRGLSGADLKASFDVLYIDGAYGDYGLDWSNQIRPFLQLGGGVIINELNPGTSEISGISPVASQTFSSPPPSGVVSLTSVPGLTDGISTNLDSANPIWAADDPGLHPFWTNGADTLGLYGQFGLGRVVFSSNVDMYAQRNGSGSSGNDYQLVLNEMNFVSHVPEPASAGCLAGVAFALSIRRPRHKA